MATKNKNRSYRIGMWFGRKFIAFFFVAILMMLSGFFMAANCGAVSIGLVSLYAAYATGHAATDIMTRNKTTTTKTDVQVTDTKASATAAHKTVVQAKDDDQDAD